MRKSLLILIAICAGSVPGTIFEEIFSYSLLQFAQEAFLEQYVRKSLFILLAICTGSVPGAVCEEIFTYSFCNLHRKRSWSSM